MRERVVLPADATAGICPVVVSIKMPEDRRQKLQDAFLGMDKDAAGRHLLEEALLARFEKVTDSNYDDIRQMKKAAEEAGFTSIK